MKNITLIILLFSNILFATCTNNYKDNINTMKIQERFAKKIFSKKYTINKENLDKIIIDINKTDGVKEAYLDYISNNKFDINFEFCDGIYGGITFSPDEENKK